MVKDDQVTKKGPEPTQAKAGPPPRGVKMSTALIAVGAAAVLTVGAALLLHGFLKQKAGATDPAAQPLLFRDWPKPEFVLMLSGEQHGYVLPCGCSRPQYGGLERRYNFLQTLKQKGWPVVSLDLGDIPQSHGPASLPNVQGVIKYVYSMYALNKMDYAAVGIGEYEASLPLEVGLAEYSLNEPSPRVLAGNLQGKGNVIPAGTTAPWYIVEVPNTKFKVGVVGVVGSSVTAANKNPQLGFDSVKNSLPGLLKDVEAKKPHLKVLLYQGSLKEAKALADKFKNSFNVIQCLSDEDEPSSRPEKVNDTMIVTVGHKGKHVGVVGVCGKAGEVNAFDLRYQMVTLGEEYLTAEKDEADHPIVKLMERY